MCQSARWIVALVIVAPGCAAQPPPREEPPRLEAYMFPAPEPGTFAIHVRLYPNAGRTFTAPADGVSVKVADERGKPAAMRFQRIPPPERLSVGPSDYRNPDTVDIGLKMDRNGAPPGMYHVLADIRADVRDAATGANVAAPTTTAAMDVYLPPVPDKEPALAPGRQFLYVPRDAPRKGAASEVFRDGQGREIPRKNLVLRVLTLERIERAGGHTPVLWFRLEGTLDLVRLAWGGDDPRGLPNLYALLEDDELRRLRALYAGHKVWGLGGLGAECVTKAPNTGGGFGTDGQRPFTVKRLYRIAQAGVTTQLGNQVGAIGGDTTSFFTSNPLLAVLDVPKGVSSTGSMWSGRVPDDAIGSPTSLCLGYYNTFAGGWDMKRHYSLLPLDRAHPDWPTAMRRAVRDGELKTGMTPEMVLWTIGWPAVFGTVADLKKLDDWEYNYLAPFHYWVNFKHGRVTGFGPDGTLP